MELDDGKSNRSIQAFLAKQHFIYPSSIPHFAYPIKTYFTRAPIIASGKSDPIGTKTHWKNLEGRQQI